MKICNIYIVIILMFSVMMTSCRREKLDINSIKVPSYYKPYEYKEFWATKGWDFTFSNPVDTGRRLKDSASMHFLSIKNTGKGIFQVSKKMRYKYMLKHAREYNETVQSIIKDNFEMYWGQSSDSLHERRNHHYTNLYFLKDSIGIVVTYTTLKHDNSKLNDYYKLINDIREKYE